MNKRKAAVSFSLLSIMIFTLSYSTLNKNNEETFVPKETASITPTETKTPEVTVVAQEPKRWPRPTISPVMKSNGSAEEIDLPVTGQPKRYLLQNPIQINKVTRTDLGDGIIVNLNYPQIEGLLDLAVQNRINDDIKGYADRLSEEAAIYRKDLRDVALNYNVDANYNNILCINIYEHIGLTDDSFSINETLLYELVNGNRLQLKDIFREELSFPGVLNKAIDEFFLRRNFEEDALTAPFRGILENQSYTLNENSLAINFSENREIRPGVSLMFRQFSIELKFDDFNKLIDIYDKYSNPGKQIYIKNVTKRKMLPNKLNYTVKDVNYVRDTYSGILYKLTLRDMVNSDFQKKINEICSYSYDEEFKKLFTDNPEKKAELYQMPRFVISYGVRANYGDVICVENNIHFSISETINKDEVKHFVYNIVTGKKLELKDIFKEGYDYKKTIFDYVNAMAVIRGVSISEADLYLMLAKSDFWFDDKSLSIYVDIDGINKDKYIPIPFDYFGEENFTIRE